MTYREFLNTVISTNISEEVTDFAKASIEKLDARNAKRATTLTKEQKANLLVMEQILAVLGAKTLVASEIAENVGISTQKASALCRQLVQAGKVKVEEVKIPKKGTVKAYSKA